ncbi:hypothetical protein EPI10_027889 [Gossypium australe]|uniref:Uncharacterized protein n=1 Tax=Gossypium australe TaxID=47621 RepID=A0A5B6UV49_9ROSI|nr:hypothetical protein EPI10_027889 [Gossypium australe]
MWSTFGSNRRGNAVNENGCEASKILSGPDNLTREETSKNVEDLQEDPREANEEPEKVTNSIAELGNEKTKEPTKT